MIYGSFNRSKVPETVAGHFPKTEEFGYELIQLRLRAVCDTMRDRDSIYMQATDAHLYVGRLGPRPTKKKKWYGIYW
jgi:hypothetical protein